MSMRRKEQDLTPTSPLANTFSCKKKEICAIRGST